ncbi:putative exonuclease [Vibrio coralliirubri]|uniref:AAA family ATPase n=1 Tax=Vibrio coralliirubri TaxID=1516159 RepID=UPI000636929A|nr:AAA family ATPase [Vibrio coralliirubri]CDT53505.1 putative exonuclease [Vibrio coralliirubri]
MKILEAQINNFLAIGEAELKLNERGLVLLQGENRDDTSQDSNGAGKSTIADSLSWAIYGITARGESGDDVVNKTAGKGCRVSILIEDADIQWRISRHRKHKENKNRLMLEKSEEGAWVDKTLGTDKLTQEAVSKLVGCSKDVFCAAIYAGQENLVDLPAMTDKALKVIVEEAAGIDRLQRGYTIATKKASKAKGVVSEANGVVSGIDSKTTMVDSNIESVKAQVEKWEVEQAESLKTLTTEVIALKKKLSSAEDKDVSAEIKEIDGKIAKLEKAIELTNEKAADHRVKDGELKSSTSSLRREKGLLDTLEAELKSANAKLTEVSSAESPSCDECGQDIDDPDARKNHIKAHSRKVKEATDKMIEQKRIIAAQAKIVRELRSELEGIDSSSFDTTKYKNALSKLSERKNELTIASTEATKLKDKLKTRAGLLKDTKAMKNPHTSMVAKFEKQKDELAAERLEAVKKVEEAEYDLLVAEGTAKVFSPAGVRAHLLDQVTPYLNDRTSHYLSIMSDGNITAVWTTLAKDSKGSLKEKFSIAVESLTGGKSFKSLSGGEKRKVRLATYLALQDLVSSRASKPIELLIADEIDQAIDKSGLERLMSILTEKAKERGTAIVISHTDLKSWISNSVTIVKEGGLSRIEGHALS